MAGPNDPKERDRTAEPPLAQGGDARPSQPAPGAVRICVCMGSSCFARGNGKNTRVLKEYLARTDLTHPVELVGLLCEGKCSAGPNLQIGDQTYRGVTPSALVSILDYHLAKGDGEKST